MESDKLALKAVDLALAAGRKRQSVRTGFYHDGDTIPLFENFCLSIALLRQKNIEAIQEGKALMERLLAFQTPEGNFPVHLHEYPKCYHSMMALKIAPALKIASLRFGSFLGEDLRGKMALALEKSLCFSKALSLSPLWEHRLKKLENKPFSFQPTSRNEWYHWALSEQLNGDLQKIPYHPGLSLFVEGEEVQEKGEPKPHPIEWAAGEKAGFSKRHLQEHPEALFSSLLFPLESSPPPEAPLWIDREEGCRLLWKGSSLHSLSIPNGIRKGNQILFYLDQEPRLDQKECVETAAYFDISPDTQILIEGGKGTVFHLGQSVEVHSGSVHFILRFELLEGNGDFSGQLLRSNRPSQTACKGDLLYEAFDWRIGLRTLRRTPSCLLALTISY